MNFRPVLGIILRQYYLLRGSPPRFIQQFIWVAVDIVVWGFMTRYLNSIASPGFSFVPVLLGAILMWDLFIRVMQGTSMAYMEDTWTRNLFNMFSSPLSTGQYLTGLVITGILSSLIGLFAMIVLASGVFGLSFFSYGLAFIPFLMIIFLFGIALGIFGCALMLRLGPAGEWFIWPIPAIISPFAAVFYPMDTMPHWMQIIGHAVPPSYVFENLRAIMQGGSASYGSLALGIGLSLAYILIASLFFRDVHARAIRHGGIARYGTENY